MACKKLLEEEFKEIGDLNGTDADLYSYFPFLATLSHQVLIVYLSGVALHTIYRSYVALPPSSATRHREPLRKSYVRVFAALAVLSLAFATVFGVKSATLSYRVWAAERGIELPGG